MFLGKQGQKVLVHKKAVPAMMGVCSTKTHHGGTANGQRKEACPPAAAGQVVDRLDARVSHTGRFQASAKCVETKETPRWDLHPLLYILLLTTYCCGDSLPEKFEAARAFYVVCCPKRKRPGQSFAGFEKAVAKLPMPVLRALAAAIRGRVASDLRRSVESGRFHSLRLRRHAAGMPSHEELEQRLGTFGKEGSPPMIWNTSIVHLTLGFPFCWRLGKGGKASERSHLIHMLPWLPAVAMIVADAGYVGYDVVATIIAAKRVLPDPHVVQWRLSTAKPTSRWTSFAKGSSTTGRNAAERRKTAHSRPIAADSQPAAQGGRVAVYQRVGSEAIVLGNGGRLAIAGDGKTRDFSEPTSGR